jgi:hypothetical protein
MNKTGFIFHPQYLRHDTKSHPDVFCSKENETDFKPYKIRREGSFVSGFK